MEIYTMKAEKYTEVKVVLILTEIESEDLMGLMQNPFSDCDPDDVTRLREMLFTSLKGALNA